MANCAIETLLKQCRAPQIDQFKDFFFRKECILILCKAVIPESWLIVPYLDTFETTLQPQIDQIKDFFQEGVYANIAQCCYSRDTHG